jgi:hypothetical protein
MLPTPGVPTVRFCNCDHVRHRFERTGAVGCEDDGSVADARNRNEIALHVIWHRLEQGRVHRDIAAACHHERIAVRGSSDGGRHSDQAIAARPVFDDDLLAPILSEFRADKPRRNVGNAAGFIRDKDADGPVREGLCVNGSGERNENGCGRRDCSEHVVLCYLNSRVLAARVDSRSCQSALVPRPQSIVLPAAALLSIHDGESAGTSSGRHSVHASRRGVNRLNNQHTFGRLAPNARLFADANAPSPPKKVACKCSEN